MARDILWPARPALILAGVLLTTAVQAAPVETPLFSRHIVPLLSRLGCNAGACHGAVQGKGGLRLSLFGIDPQLDHERLLREATGRRLNFLDPDTSLLLLKPTNRSPHEGGSRLSTGSREYQLIRAWIAAGAPLDSPERSRLTGVTVTPNLHTARPGQTYPLKVEASFADGSREDVTHLCVFESRDPVVADVDSAGRVQVLARGDVALVVRYRAHPAVAMLLVGGELKGAFPEVRTRNVIDKQVVDKLRRLGIPPAELCDDATFLRRVTLDVTGALPTPDEIRAFLADASADKRDKKIAELLTKPGYSALWATRFCDVLRPRISYEDFTHRPAAGSVRRFHDWIRARLEENTPYDELVSRMLTATSLEGRPRQEWIDETIRLVAEDKSVARGPTKIYQGRRTLDLYWHRFDAAGVPGAVQAAHAFLGLRLQCAQCHRHPGDIWSQDDVLSFANFFMRVRANTGVLSVQEAKKVTTAAGSGVTEDEKKDLTAKLGKDSAAVIKLLGISAVYHTQGNPLGWATVTSPLGTQQSKQFRLLGEARAIDVPDEQDPRELVAAWLRRPDNPFFAKAIVNRVWAHYFGRGLVDPVDDLSPLNPPTHPELLKELCDGFIASKFDLKWLHRAILTSRTYQQSATPHPGNPGDTRNYASFSRRRLGAEILIDAINHATASRETFQSTWIPTGSRVLEVAGRQVDGITTNPFVEQAFTVFGKPLRSPEAVCDCERENLPTLEQSLFLANHPDTLKKIASPTGRVAQILKAHSDDTARVEELYLWTLCRVPTDSERRLCLEHLKKSPSAQKGLEGILWSLLNSSEFLVNR